MNAREAVAKAIYETTYPGWSWEGLEAPFLEEWGRVADAALAAVERYRQSQHTVPEVHTDPNVSAYLVRLALVGRGFGSRMATDDAPVVDLVAMDLYCEDLPQPGYFVLMPDHAELVANQLLDSVRQHRAGEPL